MHVWLILKARPKEEDGNTAQAHWFLNFPDHNIQL
jgi:hypothetical protein